MSADGPPADAPRGAGLTDYLREAFLFRWNLLFFLGGVAGAALTPLSACCCRWSRPAS